MKPPRTRKHATVGRHHHDWDCPKWLVDDLNRQFMFTMIINNPRPKELLDAMEQDWSEARVFLHPHKHLPKGMMVKIIHKAKTAKAAILLLSASTDTEWFHSMIMRAASSILFVRRRIRFGPAGRAKDSDRPSMLVGFCYGDRHAPIYRSFILPNAP